MANKIRLSVLGFSFNQTQSSTYGLVLAEDSGIRRLMIVVGSPEAQSIAFKLQNVMPPRPLTHDLFKILLDSFDIELEEVLIHKFEDGVFHSMLTLKQGEKIIEIDSRTSDAVAIALRLKAPIYTTEDIMREMAVVVNEDILKEEKEENLEDEVVNESDTSRDYSLLDTHQLQDMLKDAVQDEDYELASILRDEIVKKNQAK